MGAKWGQSMLKRLFAPPDVGCRASAGLLALRLFAGTAMMIHGWKKIQHPFDWMGDKMPSFLQALAALSEFGGGLAWIVGALVPLATFGMLCTMAVAAYTHISRGDPFQRWELAALYFTLSVLLLCAGPGRFSFDAWVTGRGGAPSKGMEATHGEHRPGSA